MFSSAHTHVTDTREIPDTWIFEHYLKLDCRLMGQQVTVKSPWNPDDRRPSMWLYYNTYRQTYFFKDFSRNKSGSAFTLVHQLWNLGSVQETAARLAEEYSEYLRAGGTRDHFTGSENLTPEIQAMQWKVVHYDLRAWNTDDAKYWPQYYINSDILGIYCVRPLKSFTMRRIMNGKTEEFVVNAEYTYGYFTRGGDLYKVYQPKNPENKFLKVRDYIQGWEQLDTTPDAEVCFILASMKDMLAFKSLKLPFATLAPNSESDMLPADTIQDLRLRYKHVLTLLDNDAAGLAAMQKYYDTYGLFAVNLPMSKDVADSVRDFKPLPVREKLLPIISQTLQRINHHSTATPW